MSGSYIPRPDAAFDGFAANFSQAAIDWWLAQGLNWQALVPLEEGRNRWLAAWPAHVSAQAAARAAAAEKESARAQYDAAIRTLAAMIQNDPRTTNADRAAMGITVRQPTGGFSAIPTTRPRIRVESTQRLTHTIRITDESSLTRRARPRGAMGAEVRVALVNPHEEPPRNPEAMNYLTLATSGTATTEFRASDAGKTAVYVLRWLGKRGAAGPWSDPHCATVAA